MKLANILTVFINRIAPPPFHRHHFLATSVQTRRQQYHSCYRSPIIRLTLDGNIESRFKTQSWKLWLILYFVLTSVIVKFGQLLN